MRAGYIGSVDGRHRSRASPAPCRRQATPDSIAAAADSFVGKAWNMDGCWVLASTIAAEAGRLAAGAEHGHRRSRARPTASGSSPYNGPAGQTGNWQSHGHRRRYRRHRHAGGGGHITTCVSGCGSSAMLVDNITYENASGQVVEPGE